MEKFEDMIMGPLFPSKKNTSMWTNSKYEFIKKLTTTEKGNLGELITCNSFLKIGIDCIIKENKRGDWDLRALLKGLEHKVATQDVHGSFQFNGIQLNRAYDFLFGLGIAPNNIFFIIIPKSELLEKKTWGFCSMTKKIQGEDPQSLSYKVTVTEQNMISFENFPTFDWSFLSR